MIIAIEGISKQLLSSFTEEIQKWIDSGWEWDGTWRFVGGMYVTIVTKSKTPRPGRGGPR